jgi:hypothetical protein
VVRIRVRSRPGILRVILGLKIQLHLFRSTQIEILADHLLEEQAAVHRPVEPLGSMRSRPAGSRCRSCNRAFAEEPHDPVRFAAAGRRR